jgi:hypothetical protein
VNKAGSNLQIVKLSNVSLQEKGRLLAENRELRDSVETILAGALPRLNFRSYAAAARYVYAAADSAGNHSRTAGEAARRDSALTHARAWLAEEGETYPGVQSRYDSVFLSVRADTVCRAAP